MSTTTKTNAKPLMVGMGQALFAGGEGTLGAVLGSCIGLAIYHRRMKLAAFAHVVLADAAGQTSAPGKFADTAVPHLIELLMREGANASGLSAKIAGGASMFGAAGPMQIGDKNTVAVIAALRTAGIPLLAQHVGGSKGRRMLLDVATGDALVEIAGIAPVNL